MEENSNAATYKIWAVDNVVYGPVELPALVSWVKEERLTADTWVHCAEGDVWRKAAQVPELAMFFRSRGVSSANAREETHPQTAGPVRSLHGVKPGALRRVKVFGDFTDDQLAKFIDYMEVQTARQWTELVKQGDHGDSMFMILDGELRVRLMISGKETILTTLLPGEFFGEIALFDSGPRSADVVANKDSVLLKITSEAFEKLLREAPDLGAPFLYAIGKTLTARIRADNKRYRDSVAFARTASAGGH